MDGVERFGGGDALGLHARGLRLAPATSYEVVAYGFNIGISQLASAMARTRLFSDSQDRPASMDHVGLLDTYGRPSARDTPDASRPGGADLDAARAPLDEGDDLSSNLTALRYLIVNQAETFECWQARRPDARGVPRDAAAGALRQGRRRDRRAPLFQRASDRNGILDIATRSCSGPLPRQLADPLPRRATERRRLH